jgi:hypothetical protein
LALPFSAFSEPIKPNSTKIRETFSWNLWDRFDIDEDLTLKDFIEYFKVQKHRKETKHKKKTERKKKRANNVKDERIYRIIYATKT